MSKPWDNEPTPMCETDWNKKMKSMPLNDARNLERRMRAAERLLEDIKCTFRGFHMPLVDAHLEAAQKEDEQ